MNTRGEITSKMIGYDANGRKVTLFAQRQSDGSVHHTLRAEPRRLGEAAQLLEGLTIDNLRAIGRAAEGGAA